MEFLLLLGYGIVLIGGIWFLIVAFKESALWGIGCFLLAPVSIVFLIKYWQDSKNPFFVQLAGLGLVLIAALSGVGAQ